MAENLLKILICDDSMLMRKKLKDSLTLCGSFDILEATDGQKAVDIYKENNPGFVCCFGFYKLVLVWRTVFISPPFYLPARSES